MGGQELYKRAKQIIPGGTQLFSKRPERFLPEGWPTYYTKAKDCYIWDLDGKKYLDMSYMGVGACILGYADKDVNRAVKYAIDNGSMSTLNCPEEVELAGKLISLHPWADMVRYARTGGEAMEIAVRIARAYVGKDKIVFCGYHGWKDWYAIAGIEGISKLGVPKCLEGTAIPFKYNDTDNLFDILKDNKDIGTVVLEPQREHEPEENFLRGVVDWAHHFGAVVIFDEITSGFRETLGGIHLKYGVNPDICVLGKAMGNGYPISAVIGKKEIMDIAQDCFISSTFWTERIGPVATLATIEKMRKKKVPEYLRGLGKMLKGGIEECGIETYNILPLISFKLKDNIQQTKFNQEMLKRGILATNSVYLSYAHKPRHIKKYLKAFKKIVENIDNIKLETPVIEPNFRRLT